MWTMASISQRLALGLQNRHAGVQWYVPFVPLKRLSPPLERDCFPLEFAASSKAIHVTIQISQLPARKNRAALKRI